MKSKTLADIVNEKDEITVTIETSALEVTAAGTIEIPAYGDTLTFDDKTLNIEFTTVFKKHDKEVTISDEALHELNITLPNGTVGELKLDLPYATATLVSAGATTVKQLNDVINNKVATGGNTLTLGNGITIATMKKTNGSVVVGEGADIKALLVDSDVIADDNGLNLGSKVKKDGKQFYAQELRVIKGSADYVEVTAKSSKNPLKKVTVAKDAEVQFTWEYDANGYFYQSYTYANEVVGEGDGTAVVGFIPYYYNTSLNAAGQNHIGKISNVTIDCSRQHSDNYVTIYSELENCTIKAKNDTTNAGQSNERISYSRVYLTKSVNSLKGVKFDGVTNVYYDVPAQDGSSYSVTFDGCEFPEGIGVYTYNWGDKTPMLDKDNNPIEYTKYWYYTNYNADGTGWGTLLEVESENEIPVDIRKNGEWGSYVVPATEGVTTYKDFTIFVEFKNKCKVGEKELSITSPFYVQSSNYSTASNIAIKYNINGTLYRYAYDTTGQKNIFVTTN